jgi:hypothetical protein
MAKINWGRLVVGSLVSAVIMFFTDGFIHERLVNTDWHALYAGLRRRSRNRTEPGSLTSLSLSSAAVSPPCCSTPRCVRTSALVQRRRQ